MRKGADVRARAARVIARVVAGATLERAIDEHLDGLSERDRSLLRELCAGTLRQYPRLDAVLAVLLARPLRRRDGELRALALVGLYQLAELRVPSHAAVSATVDAAPLLRRPQGKGMLNAILRRYLREAAAIEATLGDAERHAHPAWLWDALGRHWPEDREALAAANNERPPMTLRVNERRIHRDAYAQRLRDGGIEAEASVLAARALTLETPCNVDQLPGFGDGLCSVQDESAQLAATALATADGARVLDACAAPGGKACHLLEAHPALRLTVMDVDEARLQRVRDNLSRLGLSADVLVGDASQPPAALAPGSFDAIVVDAPCSASGVLRRHPDIKVLRRASDIDTFARQQAEILRGLWPLLAPGGDLLYITCSILPAENDDVISAFLEEHADAHSLPMAITEARACRYGVQRLPAVGGGDGLYFANLRKDLAAAGTG